MFIRYTKLYNVKDNLINVMTCKMFALFS